MTWRLTSEVWSSVVKLSANSNEAHKKIPNSSSWSHHHRQTRSSLKWEEKQNLKNLTPHCFERAAVPLQWVEFVRGLIKQHCSFRSTEYHHMYHLMIKALEWVLKHYSNLFWLGAKQIQTFNATHLHFSSLWLRQASWERTHPQWRHSKIFIGIL